MSEDAEQEERLKAALWFHIGQFVDDECLRQNHNATPQFIGALTELVWAQIASSARDLETFSKHASRSIIKTDDVMLLARRNEGLENLLRRFVEDLRAKEGKGKTTATTARKRKASTAGTSSRGGAASGRGRGRGRPKTT